MPGKFRRNTPLLKETMPSISLNELEEKAKKQEDLFRRATPEAYDITAINPEATRFQVVKRYMGVKGDTPGTDLGIYNSFKEAEEAAYKDNTQNLPVYKHDYQGY